MSSLGPGRVRGEDDSGGPFPERGCNGIAVEGLVGDQPAKGDDPSRQAYLERLMAWLSIRPFPLHPWRWTRTVVPPVVADAMSGFV